MQVSTRNKRVKALKGKKSVLDASKTEIVGPAVRNVVAAVDYPTEVLIPAIGERTATTQTV